MPWRRYAGKETAIGEVFIEGNDDSGLLLRPDEDFSIGLPEQPHIARCGADGPLHQHEPRSDGWESILVEKKG
jgi:hypothetical protein